MVASSATAVPKVERLRRAKSRRGADAAKRQRSATAQAGRPLTGKGDEIRARIAANRAKRLAIAEAMKREAGVTEHTVHQDKEDLSGLAYIGTGRILSPEGRRIVELYTLAHECGHIFLHSSGEGYWLPGHVKELEAESYAHYAFREHGMRVPRRIAEWGRQYVGSWIAKDEAAGLTIDPRARAYAAGTRSAYEPLRKVPATWSAARMPEALPSPGPIRLQGDEQVFAQTVPAVEQPTSQAAADSSKPVAPQPPATTRPSWLRRLLDRWRAGLLPTLREARDVLRLASRWAIFGSFGTLYAFLKLEALYPDAAPSGIAAFSGIGLIAAVTGGLMIANLAVMWRTATRLRPARPGWRRPGRSI